ncbi:hypothetical protein N9921_03800 [Akkermansiaceae bacterium]|nr:hypothetical protein [Akkermansiaceae bacterium]
MRVFINTSSGASQGEKKAYLQHFGLKTYPKDTPGILFNLKDDPRQSKNIYEQYPEKATAMSKLLQRYLDGERCAPERN